MSRIQTPVTGISTTSAYEDGSCYSLVNLRPKNGAMHPVTPRKVMQELSQKYDIIFVHQNNDYKNWIGITVNNDYNYSSIYWDILSANPRLIQTNVKGKIHNIQQVGNTLSLVTGDKVYYLFFQNGDYIFLGELPGISEMSLGTYTQYGIDYKFDDEYGSGTITPDNFLDATKGLVNKAMDALVNGRTDKDGEQTAGKGPLLFDAHLIRYAFRLYDGTLTKHSPPILVMPPRHIVGTQEDEQENKAKLNSIKTISYDFDSTLRSESYVSVYGYKIRLNYDTSELWNSSGSSSYTEWKDIIKSVDIFISAPLGLSSIENIRTDMPTTDSPRTLNYNLIKGISSEALKNVSDTSTFYLIRSIPLGERKTNTNEPELFPSDANLSKMENLIFQEVMSDDNFSNHTYGADISYVYNNRLHLGGVKTTFFYGFKPYYFSWGYVQDAAERRYNGYDPGNAPGERYYNLTIEVEINTGISSEKVACSMNSNVSWSRLFMSGFISYPDPRAKKITIYRWSDDTDGLWRRVFTAPLEPHRFLNLAYYISNGLNPIVEDESPGLVQRPTTSETITLSEPNKIKVSELNNPLSFPNINTYLVSSGTILNMATNAMNVSDRNYGQYPLYVFTTQGIWNLNVGSGEVVYTSQSAPTYTEAPASPVVCSTPFGVVFTTQRGLHMINGQSVDFISPQLEQDSLRVNMELPDSHCKDVVHLFNDKSFSDYLRGIENIIYNPHESEIIICDKDSQYNYVLNLPSQSFYKSTERIDLMVGNTFPQLLVMGGNQLKDFATFNTPGTHICLVMRPLTFGTPDIKNLERSILRALLMDIQNVSDKKSIILVHDSNDGINFRLSRGIPTDPCSRRDFDMGLFASSKSRQFMFSFAGIVDESSRINFLDTQIRQEYNNTKMR